MNTYQHAGRMCLGGIITYVASFAIGFLVIQALGYDMSLKDVDSIPLSLWYTGIASGAFVMYLTSVWYFSSPGIIPSIREGLIFGFVVTGIGFVIDTTLLLPQIIKNGANELMAYFAHPLFAVAVVVFVLVSALVGWIEGHRRPPHYGDEGAKGAES